MDRTLASVKELPTTTWPAYVFPCRSSIPAQTSLKPLQVDENSASVVAETKDIISPTTSTPKTCIGLQSTSTIMTRGGGVREGEAAKRGRLD
jgi:hypothetical protein